MDFKWCLDYYHTQYNANVKQLYCLEAPTKQTSRVLSDTVTTGLRTFAKLSQLCPETPGTAAATPKKDMA